MRTALLILILLAADWAAAAERDYQMPWCAAHGGTPEYVLPDRTRVDCLTETHAIEFDFAKKWAEALGQALFYASWTNRRAAIVLIMGPKDEHFMGRLRATVEHYGLPVDIWRVDK